MTHSYSWYLNNFLANYPFFFALFIMIVGLVMIAYCDNLIKKVFGLTIFQAGIIIFYIAISKINHGVIPVKTSHHLYNNPLPHVLMLTAIVVGFALTAVAYALIVKIKKNYNSISEQYINTLEAGERQ